MVLLLVEVLLIQMLTVISTLTINIGSNNVDDLTASCSVPTATSNSVSVTPIQGVITLSVDGNNPYVGDTINLQYKLIMQFQMCL